MIYGKMTFICINSRVYYYLNFFSGKPYGSYYRPQHTGCKGGGSYPGHGGGRVDILIASSLHLDGNIKTLGGNATGANSGGGSGGSIYIVTQNFSGHGLIQASGGDGHGYGYGGAGGRIAVHVQWFQEYTGDMRTYGGTAGHNTLSSDLTRNGAGGTVFTSDSNGTLAQTGGYEKLIIDNDNRNHILGTVLMAESDHHVFEVDELESYNHVVLWLDGTNSELIVHKFEGDRTGSMHVRGQQKVYVEYVRSTSGYTVAPVSLNVENGTEIVLPSTTILLGTRTKMKGLMTMVQNMTVADGANCVFSSTAQTALIEAGKYVHQTLPGNISLSHLTIQRGSKVTFTETESDLVLSIVKISIKYEALMLMNHGKIHSESAVVESLGVLNIDFMGHDKEKGFGAGTSDGQIGYGAAHGGHGGAPEGSVGGTPYDSVYKPTERGSGGGNGNGLGGRGGGYLHWINGKDMWIDGEITLEGENGQSGSAGGGSGGGILIETLNITGFGHIDCHGGDGINNGGGGAGGRVSIHVHFAYKYRGLLNVVGGKGNGSLPSGAAGTVYIQENARGPQYADIKYDQTTNTTFEFATHRRIEINNNDNDKHLYINHKEPWLYTVLYEGKQTEYAFDETLLEGHSNLLIEYPLGTVGKDDVAAKVWIHLFYGDNTGVVRLRDGQKLYVEVVESISNETIAPCSFRIDNGSEIFLPSTTNLYGTRSVFAGKITGVEILMIRGGSNVVFLSTAQTALMENREYIIETTLGNFSFAILRVMAFSIAEFRDITGLCVITTAEFYVKYRGLLLMNVVQVDSAYSHIESQGELNMDGVGFIGETGPGAGYTLTDSSGIGLGAGHGGYGGGPGPSQRGRPYNSVYKPLEDGRGSGGGHGGGKGGNGGGYMFWNSGDLIEMNGLLTLAGTSGKGGNAGGGSGGSLVIDTTNMTGHGVISVHGGNGVGNGGGGSGGRVSINCRFRYSYGGKYHNYGGNGENGINYRMHAGASGTTFKKENLREVEYSIKKYDPIHNTTFMDADHHMIHSDNWLKYSPAPTLIQDPPKVEYEFDEMELRGSTYALFYHPPNASLVNVTVHRFIGDKTGQLHMRPYQKVWVEYVESVTNVTEAPCSFILDHNAEIVFPAEVHIHGTNSSFGGKITGVQNLYIENQSWTEFLSTANTSQIINGEYRRETRPGHFIWDQFHVKRGGEVGYLHIDEDLVLETSEIRVKYQGNIYMNEAKINSTYSWIESEGVLHLNGHGHDSEQGPGRGNTRQSEGYGASHGGYGGGPDPKLAVEPYGSVFSPQELGSGGGNGQGKGGRGGGKLHWITSHYFELQGLLALQGTDGDGINAGGGSGGSLLIETMNFTGHGEINTGGGSASGKGGGGAGGRAAIHCEWRYDFGGTFVNHGGLGGSTTTRASHGGAAGTTFVKNNKRQLEYRILKYIKGTNLTYFDVDHRYL